MAHLPLTRRTLLSAALLPALPAPAPAWQHTLAARAAALPTPGLLQSYDVSGNDDFAKTQANAAYTYDNALAGLALLHTGNAPAARTIADALAHAQSHDRTYRDGRLRNAYRSGPIAPTGPIQLPGWWNPDAARWMEDAYQAGTATGNVAWAILLWIALGPDYRQPASRAADWLETHTRTARGYSGGFLGFEPNPQRLAWVSTEHNTDLAAAFAALGRTDAANHARSFVADMWQPAESRFATGLKPDGTVNPHSAVDANLWPLLIANTNPHWTPALDWILARHGLPANGPPADMQGVDFNTDRDGIWLEGTAITALTAARANRPATAARLLQTLKDQTAPTGLIYASSTPTLTTGLSTGLDTTAPDFLYYRRPHLAPTAWAILAQHGANPFPR